MSRSSLILIASTLALTACASSSPPANSTPPPSTKTSSQAQTQSNTFYQASSLQFLAPHFDRIKDSEYQPAIEEGMKRNLAEIQKIADQAEPPTFDNTIVAMEKSGDLLIRVTKVFVQLAQSNTNETLQKVQAEEAPKLAAHQDAIFLNAKLYARVKEIFDKRDSLGLDAESKYLVERYHLAFVRAGAQLKEEDKATLRALNQEEAKLTTEFHDKLLAATSSAAIVVDDKAKLEGLTEGDVAAAAEAAKGRKLEGKWVLAIQNTTQQPAQVSLKDRTMRERLFKASTERTEHGDKNDTRAIIQRLAQLRAQRAKLLGFANNAAYVLDDQMAKSPDKALKLMTDIVPAAISRAQGEAKKMQALAKKQKQKYQLAPWDWQYYAEQVRKAEYAFDEAQIKPYFELNRVLQDGVFFAATQLYGITFKERKDLPVYHPDVRAFEVIDGDGKPLAIFYGDYFKRDNKSGGAWMSTFVDQSTLLGTHPVVVNVCNFTKPAPGQPALISYSDVTTMFHEFGHALHGMFSNVKYPMLTDVPRDFVEFPSQFNEHWAIEPAIFANYAKHHETGAPMPQPLVDKIKKAHTFNKGYETTEYLAAALLDIAWQEVPAETAPPDVAKFEGAALKRFKVDFPLVPPRYKSTYFAHIWNGGYAAGYYAYLWSEVLDDDAYQWFVEHGGLKRDNGQRFRDMVLSRGGTQEAASMYRAFRGKDPSVEPLLIERGLKENGKKKR
jgi:peptidyl-dipeptidase Dcp